MKLTYWTVGDGTSKAYLLLNEAQAVSEAALCAEHDTYVKNPTPDCHGGCYDFGCKCLTTPCLHGWRSEFRVSGDPGYTREYAHGHGHTRAVYPLEIRWWQEVTKRTCVEVAGVIYTRDDVGRANESEWHSESGGRKLWMSRYVHIQQRTLDLSEPVATRSSVIALLNELLALDPEMVTQFFRAEVPVNGALADHPTVEVGHLETPVGDRKNRLRVLGLLNGLFPDDSSEIARNRIAKVVDMVCAGCGVVLEDVPIGEAHVGDGPGYRVQCGSCIEGPIREFTAVLV